MEGKIMIIGVIFVCLAAYSEANYRVHKVVGRDELKSGVRKTGVPIPKGKAYVYFMMDCSSLLTITHQNYFKTKYLGTIKNIFQMTMNEQMERHVFNYPYGGVRGLSRENYFIPRDVDNFAQKEFPVYQKRDIGAGMTGVVLDSQHETRFGTDIGRVLVVLLAGPATGGVAKILENKQKLERRGVIIIAIGLKGEATTADVMSLATGSQFQAIYSFQNFPRFGADIAVMIENGIQLSRARRKQNEPTQEYDLKVDIMLVVDCSSNLVGFSQTYFKDQLMVFIKETIGHYQVGFMNVKFSMILYGDSAEVSLSFYTPDYVAIKNVIDALTRPNYDQGMISVGLQAAIDEWERIEFKSDRKRILLLITTGDAVDMELVKKRIVTLFQMGVQIECVAIGPGGTVVGGYIQSQGGFFQRYTEVSLTGKSASFALKLYQKILDSPNPTTAPPPDVTTTVPPTPVLPPGGCEHPTDLVFVIDISNTIGAANFDLIKTFMGDVIGKFAVHPHKTRVGLITFGKSPAPRFDLSSYVTATGVLQGINRVTYWGETDTKIAPGLTAALEFFQGDARKEQLPQYSRVIMLLTDGILNTNEDLVAANTVATEIKAKEYQIITIGIGQVQENNLRGWASDPSFYIHESDYPRLQSEFANILPKICQAAEKTPATTQGTTPPTVTTVPTTTPPISTTPTTPTTTPAPPTTTPTTPTTPPPPPPETTLPPPETTLPPPPEPETTLPPPPPETTVPVVPVTTVPTTRPTTTPTIVIPRETTTPVPETTPPTLGPSTTLRLTTIKPVPLTTTPAPPVTTPSTAPTVPTTVAIVPTMPPEPVITCQGCPPSLGCCPGMPMCCPGDPGCCSIFAGR